MQYSKERRNKKIAGCPRYSDDGKIEIFIKGRDVTNKKYNKKLILKNDTKK